MNGIFLCYCHYKPPRPDLGPTQLPIQWAPPLLSQGAKRPGREACVRKVVDKESRGLLNHSRVF